MNKFMNKLLSIYKTRYLLLLAGLTLLAPVMSLAQSAPIKQQPKQALKPVVKRLFASSTEQAITLHWTLSSTQNLNTIQLYRKAYEMPIRLERPNPDKPAKIDRGLLVAELKPGQSEFTDTRAQAGYYYYYRLVLQDKQLLESEPSPPALAVLQDKMPPQPVAKISLQPNGDKQFKISWQASPSSDVVAYRLYRASLQGQPHVIRIFNLQKRGQKRFVKRLDFRGNASFVYRYFIAAVDGSGNVSKLSDAAQLRMPDHAAPKPPALLTATQKNNRVELQWQAGRENDLQGYRVYRRPDQVGKPFKPLHKQLLTDNHFSDRSAQPLQPYYYRVAAVDRYGNESEATPGILFRTTRFSVPVQPPQRVALAKNRKGIPVLSWRASKQPVAGYLVSRSDGGEFITVSGLLHKPGFVDRSARRGLAYRYQVQALSSSGQRSAPSATLLWRGGKR